MTRPYHRPTLLGPGALDSRPGAEAVDREELAQSTALIIVRGARQPDTDPATVDRLLRIVDEYGIELLADLWATSPARSLPGALWRLYLLHTWVRRSPREAAAQFDAGRAHTPVLEAIAGVAEPPGPDQVAVLVDEVLRGAFRGDFAVALERAAAFAQIVAVGRTVAVPDDEEAGMPAARLVTLAEDLTASARLWRAGDL